MHITREIPRPIDCTMVSIDTLVFADAQKTAIIGPHAQWGALHGTVPNFGLTKSPHSEARNGRFMQVRRS
jgi:hypothetical protein